MIFFEFKTSANTKVIGRRFPQISDISDANNYDRDAPNSIFKANLWGEVSFDLNIPSFILHGHAKRTDLVSNGGFHSHFMLFSKRLKELIETFNLPRTQTFATKVLARKSEYEYFIFYLPAINYELIDFEQSTFCLADWRRRKKVKQIGINNLGEFQGWVKKYPYLVKWNPTGLNVVAEKLVFNAKKNPFDMFRFLGPVNGYFVSERLKDAIEEAGCTGMEFVPIEEIKNVI